MSADEYLGIDWSAAHNRVATAQRSVDAAFLADPKTHQALMRERTRRLAVRQHGIASNEIQNAHVLIFALEATRYALNTCIVSAIGPWQPVRAIPGGSRPLMGLFTARGALWALYDLPLLLGSEQRSVSAGGYLLYLRDWPRQSALRVDEVIGIKNLDVGQLASVTADTPEGGRFVHGISNDGLVVLNPEAIRNHPVFLEGL